MTDFYTRIHKLVRARLFALSTLAGRSDLDDPAGAAVFATTLHAELAWLDSHASSEDTFVAPLLRRVAPAEAAEAEAAHDALHVEAEALRAAVAALTASAPRDGATNTRCDGLGAYRMLNRFVAHHLAHLDHEETVLLPLLWARCPEAELAAAMGAFHASRSAAKAEADLVAMFPVLAPTERAQLLEGLRATVPPAAYAALVPLLRGEVPLA